MKQLKLDEKSFPKLEELTNTFILSLKNEVRKSQIQEMMKAIGWRYYQCPASNRVTQHNCFPGGLVEHSIRVTNIFQELCKQYYNVDEETLDSIVVVGLFHDLGKIGRVYENDPSRKSLSDFMFLNQDSVWHQKNLGEYYLFNENLQFMKYSARSLQILNFFGIKLNELEFQMIYSLSQGEEGSVSSMGNLPITLFQTAKRIAIEKEKERYTKWLSK